MDQLRSGTDLGKRVDEIVSLSLANLQPFVTSMFLDAATVMHDREEEHAIATWNSMRVAEGADADAGIWLRKLMSRSLVKAEHVEPRGRRLAYQKLWVHDVLKALAGQMVLAERPVTRVWRSKQVSGICATPFCNPRSIML